MTQFLPTDDLFAEGSPAYGGAGTGFLPLYISTRFTTSAISSIWLPNGLAIGLRPPMHSGYQSVNPLTGQIDYNAAFYNSGTGSVGHANSRQPSAMAFRQAFGADVIVQGIIEMRSLAGSLSIAELAPRGVFARYQAGTLGGDGTANPDLSNGSCYLAALYQKQSDSGLRLGVLKFVGGVVTVLGESVSVPLSLVNFASLFTITLNVTGTSIFATATSTGSSTTIRAPSGVAVYTDSAVAGGGRCGLMMGADREPVAGRKQVDLCHMLRVEEAGTVKLQDEFQRLSLAASKRTTADISGVVGNYLSSAFYWDAGTFDESYSTGGRTYTGARKLLRNATAGRLQFNHTTTDDDANAGRLILSQRPADSRFSQHRKLRVIIPTTAALATGEVWAGIALRARQPQPLDEVPPVVLVGGSGPNFAGNGSASTAGNGYMFVVRARSTTQVIWQIHRVVNGNHFPVCNLTENSPFTIFPGYGVQFTLDFEVFPRNEADPFGPVEMVAKVGASLLAMVLTTSATNNGCTNPSAGHFVDPSSGRIQSNRGEGIVAVNGFFNSGGSSADIDPIFEAWEQDTLTNVVVLDQDQASVSLLTEGAAAGTALDTILTPSELPIDYQSWSISTQFDSGHRQTVPRFISVVDGSLLRRQTMRFSKAGARETELVALIAHFNDHRGIEIPFNFTPPGGTATKVHYKTDRIEWEMVAPDAYTLSFELETLV